MLQLSLITALYLSKVSRTSGENTDIDIGYISLFDRTCNTVEKHFRRYNRL